MGEGEINAVAHSGHAEQISGLGDALNEANRRSRSPGTGGEDDDAPVDWGLFRSRASGVLLHGVVAELGDAERERGSGCGHGERRRCAPARSVGHGRERAEGREEVAGEGERGQGSLGVCVASRGHGEGGAGGGSRRWSSVARALTRRRPPGRS